MRNIAAAPNLGRASAYAAILQGGVSRRKDAGVNQDM